MIDIKHASFLSGFISWKSVFKNYSKTSCKENVAFSVRNFKRSSLKKFGKVCDPSLPKIKVEKEILILFYPKKKLLFVQIETKK